VLRPDDDVELKRRILVKAVTQARGTDLKKIRVEVGLNSRTSAITTGWVSAFRQYPFELKLQAEPPAKLFDIEEGALSSGKGTTTNTGLVCLESVGSGSYSGSNHTFLAEEAARTLLDNPDRVRIARIRQMSRIHELSGEEILRQCDRSSLKDALVHLIASDELNALHALLGGLSESSTEQLISAAKISRRMGRQGSGGWIEGAVERLLPDEIGSFCEPIRSFLRGSSEED
jgi:hypothetical protein